MLWASLVLLLSAPAEAHLIRIPTEFFWDSTLPAPLDLDGGTLSAIHRGAPATEFMNFASDFVFGISGDGVTGSVASFTLDFDRPVSHVTLKAGVLNQGAFTVQLWNGGNVLTTTAADTIFPGGGFLPTIVEITPSQPATRLTIDGADWVNEITFWSADVTFVVPEPVGLTNCLLPIVAVGFARVARRAFTKATGRSAARICPRAGEGTIRR